MTELFPNFQSDPTHFYLAAQLWEELWASVCTSADWQTGWLNTAAQDGTPFADGDGDGDGILSAINRSESKALKVVQRPLVESKEVHTWSTWFGIDAAQVRLTVVAGPLTERTRERVRAEFEKIRVADFAESTKAARLEVSALRRPCEPFPSCPSSLFPQHDTRPSFVKPHVCPTDAVS